MTKDQEERVSAAWESQANAIARAQSALVDVEAMASVLRQMIDELHAEISEGEDNGV